MTELKETKEETHPELMEHDTTTEDKEELKRLEEVGQEIDRQHKYQQWLKDNKEKLSDNKYILYRLPLSHEQREAVYQNLLKEAEEKRKEKELKS